MDYSIPDEILAEEDSVTPEPVNLFLVLFLPALIILTTFIGTLSSKISKYFFKATNKEKDLARTVVELKTEMKSISMVDEFAKYAKIQRRLNQINLDLEATVGCRQSMQEKVKYIGTIVGHVITTLMIAVTVYNYRTVPVVIVPESWFYPVTPMLSYPTQVPGAISVISWMFIVRSLAPLLIKA